MRRIHLFEFEDQSWCPRFLRESITDFLFAVTRFSKLWLPTADILNRIVTTTGHKQILVLGAGSGGGILDVAPHLNPEIKILLTDLYPNQSFQSSDPRISYYEKSVNATDVPRTLEGVRVMYASFHHLKPDLAKAVLQNAVQDRQPIAIFEGTERSFKGLVALTFVPLIVFIITPFMKPLRWSRLVFTYLIPILSLAIFWDGLVSALRTYDLEKMKELVKGFNDYDWKIEILHGPHQENVPSLVGTPKAKDRAF